ncbi:unnamed protein product [Enterobius vermicularis]|uniref:Cilia- and flagella-associated protein 36 n=1 Tax=Enterobius vermicularis TaxID=51028 RepID=A0A0N4V962_ENTVE|nr:unnamed protein product [Enterobius vermicularis]
MFCNRYGPYGRRALDNTMLFRFFLEFIKSSMWTLPIATFIEQKSLVFDREQEDKDLYKKIHKEFVSLVDALMECFCDDLHVKAEQLVASMKENHFKSQMTVKGRVSCFNNSASNRKCRYPILAALLEPVAAAQDYEVFVSMMMRKNIELQLQAIHMIEVICGLVPAVLRIDVDEKNLEDVKSLRTSEAKNAEDSSRTDPLETTSKHDQNRDTTKHLMTEESGEENGRTVEAPIKGEKDGQKKAVEDQTKAEMKAWDDMVKNLQIDPNEYENTILVQVLKDSKKEFETDLAKRKELLEEMERARRENVAEKERLEQSRENEEFTFREALRKNISSNLTEGAAKQKKNKKKIEVKLQKEAFGPTSSADEDKSNKTVAEINAMLEKPKRIGTADVEERKDYLRKQRDKLLAMKKVAREKQFKAAANNAKTKAERPKTAQAAREAMAGAVLQPTYISEEILAARHEMALKLKNNLLMIQESA